MYFLYLENIKIIILFEHIIVKQIDSNDKKLEKVKNKIEEMMNMYSFFLDLIGKEKINLKMGKASYIENENE